LGSSKIQFIPSSCFPPCHETPFLGFLLLSPHHLCFRAYPSLMQKTGRHVNEMVRDPPRGTACQPPSLQLGFWLPRKQQAQSVLWAPESSQAQAPPSFFSLPSSQSVAR
jgi:hypothetical protein